MYPPIDAYDGGTLEVGDGCRIYYEISGNPGGKPALVLHGAPGSGSTPQARRQFDRRAWRIVQFDQRGCGRSTPHACRPDADLSTNTTPHLFADIELLRVHLRIERWLLRGSSWGSVLALGESDGDVSAAYKRLLYHSDPEVRERAARAWCDWEIAMLPTALAPPTRYDTPAFRRCFARLVTHYWSNGSWLDNNQVLRNAGRLAGIPGVIVQGRLDLTNLSGTPWELAAAWSGSEIVIVEDTGHDGGPDLLNAVVAATDKYRNTPP